VGIKTPLDMESIVLQDDWQKGQEKKTTLVSNKGKRNHLNTEDLGLGKNPRSKDKGKIP